MDAILTPLINAGIPGAMAAAFIYFCWHVVTKTIPEQRAEFMRELARQHVECVQERAEARAMHAAERAEERAQRERANERLAAAMGELSGEVRGMRADRRPGEGRP